MIIWLPSYARSGNTFFRILIHQLYGLPTYTGFKSGDDISGDFPDRNPTGHAELPEYVRAANASNDPAKVRAALERLEGEPALYFIKTHAYIDDLHHNRHRAVLLVRDGRDALVSFGWYTLNVLRTLGRLRALPRIVPRPWTLQSLLGAALVVVQTAVLQGFKAIGLQRVAWRVVVSNFGFQPPDTWSKFNLGWVERPGAKTAVIRFEDLVSRPLEALRDSLAEIGVELAPGAGGARPPTFAELQQMHPTFFRSGQSGNWRQELPAQVQARFIAANRAGLRRFGYAEEVDGA